MRRLFVGLSGPVGYDYWRGGTRPERPTPPNAVLEDVTGLLLCYDELWFLSRDFCPRDMWDLPYAHFVSDNRTLLSRALTAYDQYADLIATNGSLGYGDISGHFTRTIHLMTGGDRSAAGIDNHSRRLEHLPQIKAIGDSSRVDCAVYDVGIAAALDVGRIDVLTNTVASSYLNQHLDLLDIENRFSEWQVRVAAQVAAITVPNQLGSNGGYHEELEEYRSDPQVREFRQLLEEERPDERTAADAARDITELAASYGRKAFLTQYERRPIYKTIGRFALKPVGNATVPGAGTVADGALKTLEYAKKAKIKKASAWAAFVLRAQERASRSGSLG